MAQVHAIDGATITHIGQAPWEQAVIDQSLNIIAVHQRLYRLTLLTNIMPMSVWETLKAKEIAGAIVSVTAPPPTNPNGDYVTYYEAKILRLDGRHDSINMTDVTVELSVKV